MQPPSVLAGVVKVIEERAVSSIDEPEPQGLMLRPGNQDFTADRILHCP